MNMLIDSSKTQLAAKEKKAVMSFCHALSDAQDANVRSIVLYGSCVRKDYRPGESDINILVVFEHIDVPILKSVLNSVNRARRYRIAPFFITEENLRSSADVFPLKFLGMQESYQLLLGHDVLGGLKIKREHIRLRCEQEIKNLLLRLRRHFIMGGGRGLTKMMSNMIVGFLENLRVVLSLSQENLTPREELINAAAKAFDFDAEILRKVRSLRGHKISLSRREAEKLYDQFMAIVYKVAQATDQIVQ